MERSDVFRSDFVVLHDRGVGNNRIAVGAEHTRSRLGTAQILVAVSQTLDDPRGLDVDENREVIGRARRLEHAGDFHLQRIGARQIKNVLGR